MPKIVREELLAEEALYENLDMSSERAREILSWLEEEHRKALYAHTDYFDQLRIFRRAIKAQPATKIKTFPWPGASNLVVPIIRIAGDAVKARIINTLLSPKPFWTATATSSMYAPYAKPIERFMEWAFRNDLDAVNTIEAIGDQVVYLGKCPVRYCWEEVVSKVMSYDPKTKKKTTKLRVLRDSPLWHPILLENWLEPWGLKPSNQKPWNSERVFYRLSELKELQTRGLIGNLSKLEEKIMEKLPSDLVDESEMRKKAWADTEVATLYLTCFRYDYDRDGFGEEMQALWSLECSELLSLKFNYFWHGHRPLEFAFYLRDGFDRSEGDGLAQLLNPLQESMSTFVNQRTDNITLANTRAYKGKKGEVKKGPQNAIYPGSITLLTDPEKDLVPMEMGTVSPQSFQHESVLRDYAERLSGVSDPQLGREFNNPRVAATTTLSVLQEGNRRFDLAIRLLREVFSTLGMRTLQLYQQFKPRVPLGEILSPEDEIYVQEILNMQPEQVEGMVVLALNTSTATTNKETQRQGLLALHQLIVGFYSQILNVAIQIMANPQFPDSIKDMIIDMAQASYNTIKEILYTYDINDPGSFLIDVAEALNYVRGGGDAGGIESAISSGLAEIQRLAGVDGGSVQGQNPSPIPTTSGVQNQSQLAGAASGAGSQPSSNGGGITSA